MLKWLKQKVSSLIMPVIFLVGLALLAWSKRLCLDF